MPVSKFVPQKIRPAAVSLFRKARIFLFRVVASNRFFMRLFHLFSSDFDREFESTLKGRYQALTSIYLGDKSNANIRRGVHRLEKGLFHANRRPKFGNAVFNQLERELVQAVNLRKVALDSEEINWAISTLEKYTEFAASPERVQEMILLLKDPNKVDELTFEFLENEEASSVDFAEYEGLASIYKRRESVRFFDSKVPLISDIAKAVSIAKEAPSACNRQPFSVTLLRDSKDINFVGGLAPGTAGFLDNIPLLGVVTGHASCFRKAGDRHLIYTDSGLFMGHLLPALQSLGIDTCVLNWNPDWVKDRKAVQYLNLDLSKTIVCLIAFGYRRDSVDSPVSTKKSDYNILRIN